MMYYTNYKTRQQLEPIDVLNILIYNKNFQTQYNEEKLKELINNSFLITGDNYKIQAPVNSYVKYDKTLKSGKIVKNGDSYEEKIKQRNGSFE